MSFAFITPTYAKDYERCLLLCKSIDLYVTGYTRHYLLVADEDKALFEPLASPQRVIIEDSALFPSPLKMLQTAKGIMYQGNQTLLTGWHIQQLRKLACAFYLEEKNLITCDSDILFIKPFEANQFQWFGKLKLYQLPEGITHAMPHHQKWITRAGQVLGLSKNSNHDYISPLVAWQRETLKNMLYFIESKSQMSWLKTLSGSIHLSECLLYGRYVTEVIKDTTHHTTYLPPFCHMYWGVSPLPESKIEVWVKNCLPSQYAVGFQSRSETHLKWIIQATGFEN